MHQALSQASVEELRNRVIRAVDQCRNDKGHIEATRQQICHYGFRGNQCWTEIDHTIESLLALRMIRRKSVDRHGRHSTVYTF